jgi:hypothetical protein
MYPGLEHASDLTSIAKSASRPASTGRVGMVSNGIGIGRCSDRPSELLVKCAGGIDRPSFLCVRDVCGHMVDEESLKKHPQAPCPGGF